MHVKVQDRLMQVRFIEIHQVFKILKNGISVIIFFLFFYHLRCDLSILNVLFLESIVYTVM